MKFSVGYSLIDNYRFNEAVEDFSDSISEIYFSWPGIPSGRSSNIPSGQRDMEIERLLCDLSRYSGMGLPLVILFNGNCYGSEAVSSELIKKNVEIVDTVCSKAGKLSSITTASPFIASKMKELFPDLQIRASVNMRIAKTEAMEYLKDNFDFFYIAKELNRNIVQIKEMKTWASQNDKKIGLLANSGCLNYCSNQTFHDNLVAHESELKDFNTEYYQPIQCRKFLQNRKNWKHLLSSSNWIRPEDLGFYEELFESVKLATRMHFNPYMVIAAYSSAVHKGNILDLTEPGFSGIISPEILENDRFPYGWSAQKCTSEEAEDLLPGLLKEVSYGVVNPVKI